MGCGDFFYDGKLSESGCPGLKDFQDVIVDGMWGFFDDRKLSESG